MWKMASSSIYTQEKENKKVQDLRLVCSEPAGRRVKGYAGNFAVCFII